ncbi:putative ABC transport system ATP-binding protein [Clostridium sp. DSM 8431]|uniref:ABC transporter ATP-binding protein n=1 Tax=Clostridium sp. DSM 8431 TaxID=1761781 RepID=UPI0008EC2485|nr:ABC transporter ATP-binding protein [Clostridium sp. DSM 8431]SFU34599.1 putative ABC transport system ATP-binding protein [Clostridium sp. DSM 8431]
MDIIENIDKMNKITTHSVIEAKNLKKVYKTGTVENTVIHNLSLSIKSGEFVTITGPSGSGKSTLLYLLSGMEPLTDGVVYLKGKDLTKMDDKEMSELRRTDMGFVYQFYNLLEEMNVADNVFLPSLIKEKKLDINRLRKVLEMVGLTKYEASYPYELSGGQQQRVAIARALYTNPEVIFADEPTGNLDSISSEQIMEIFKKINKEFKTTIIMVTHSDKLAKEGTRQIVMKDGQIC